MKLEYFLNSNNYNNCRNFNISPTYLITFIVSLLLAILIYGFELTHFTLSVDEAIWPDHNYSMSIAIGRWMYVLLKLYIFPKPYIPFFTTFITLIFLAVAASIIAKSFNFNLSKSLIFSSFFIGLPQFAYQLEYTIQSDTVALGLILTSLGFYYFISRKEYNIIICYIVTTLCFIFSLAIYQSLILIPITLYFAKIIYDLNDKNLSLKSISKDACFFYLTIIISSILYLIITKLFIYLTDTASINYSQQFMGWNTEKSLQSNIYQVLTLIHQYTNSNIYPYALELYLISIIPIVGLILSAIFHISLRNTLILCAAIFLFFSPFLLCFIFGHSQPARTLLSLSLAMALLFVILLEKFNVIKITTFIATIVVITGIANSSRLFYSDHVTYETDKALANRIYYSIQDKYPKFSPNVTPVYFRAPLYYTNLWKIEKSETFGASHFYVDDKNSSIRIVQLFKIANIAEIQLPNKEIMQELDKLCLPSWPNKESIQMIDGVLVVNLRKDLVRKPNQVCNAP